jgi:hypothetical protein
MPATNLKYATNLNHEYENNKPDYLFIHCTVVIR